MELLGILDVPTYPPQLSDAIVFAVLIVVLLVKPTGILRNRFMRKYNAKGEQLWQS